MPVASAKAARVAPLAGQSGPCRGGHPAGPLPATGGRGRQRHMGRSTGFGVAQAAHDTACPSDTLGDPAAWRLHRVHHADPELDATSALRFHPLEILLSMLLKMAAVVMLGAPPVAVLLFEILLNGSALFNHAAIRLPAWLERGLRTLFVTPGMHRIHHSEEPSETDRCFGFCLSLWDRIFGTNLPSAAAGEAIRIGVTGWRASYWQRLDRLLLLPFR